MTDQERWQELGQQLRVDSVRAAAAAGSGHPTSSMSAADLMAVLLDRHLRYDFSDPDSPVNDHLIFSKGHASPLVYSLFKAAGAITDEELLSFRKLGSPLEGHPTPVLPWVDVATGSLGQGLPIGVGVALAGKRLDRLPYRVWVLCGDSEMAEGSMWEAFEHAAYDEARQPHRHHRRQPAGPARRDHARLGPRLVRRRAEAFGWHAIEIDGHDVAAIDAAYAEALSVEGRPTVIVARTLKGKGVARSRTTTAGTASLSAIPTRRSPSSAASATCGSRCTSASRPSRTRSATEPLELPRYELGNEVATRKAYGDALAALGAADGKVVALDGEVSNSTYAEIFGAAHPDRFFEMYIAEQQMVAAAVGLQVRGWKPFASTFAAFLTRAYDFIRMAAVSRATLALSGSHAGVSIGEDGPSQMALEDLAMMRAVGGSTVLYPCDANQTAQLVATMAELEGISYLRTTRAATPVVYGPDDDFPVGGSRVLRSSEDDDVTIVGAGITVVEALAAADALAEEGISARVVDCYSVKPIDAEGLREAAAATGALVTVEDHWPEGGLGEAVLSALVGLDEFPAITRLAVTGMPGSGTPAELLAAAGIDREHIADAARRLAGARALR